MLERFQKALHSEKGQGMAEYALILVLIAIVCLAATKGLGTNIRDKLNKVSTEISNSDK